MRIIKVVATDIAGVGLIVLAILTGWLPGPGGIPLFIAGLGLLAINHEWARKLLSSFKRGGLKLAETFFKDHPILVLLYDFLALLAIGGGIVITLTYRGLTRGLAIFLIFIGLSLLLGNRRRLQRINKFFRKNEQ